MRLQGLPPVLGESTRLLVLGSFPGARSLALQQYYAHPQNQFWTLVGTLLGQDLKALPYPERLHALRRAGVGLWDVYASCERQGSLDSAIRNAQVNELDRLKRDCPQLRVIAHNGGESFRHARHTQALGLPVLRLPSSSPANASQSLDFKLAIWREALLAAGLLAP
jgi:hypoxanthine-DNA glycosylase